ncbi:TERF1-interacting nuclear factor 2 isoform X2 [Pempheris klunzingeri]
MKQRDVMQYGVVEDFVTSACETVPGLLTMRHQGKLALGLRGRLILELCSTQPDEEVIKQHLQRMRPPPALSPSSASTVRGDAKIMRTVESFHSLVQTLLTDRTEREYFFKEEFPVDYGPKFDQELEKLLWEFLIRLDQLLPVPNLAQTVSWLSDAPPVLEECAWAATQPQLLKMLLQHQTFLGHLETAVSLPSNIGDSILASLSLPPSGRVPSNQPAEATNSPVDQTGGTETGHKASFITPVIGLISNEDVPVMISANKRTLRSAEAASSKDETKESLKFTAVKQTQNPNNDGVKEKRNAPKRNSGTKRKQPEAREDEFDKEEEEPGMTRSGKKWSLRNGTSRLGQRKGDQRTNEGEEDGVKAVSETRMAQLGVKTLHLPKDPSLCSIFVSCLSSQPRVVINKLSVTSASANRTRRRRNSIHSDFPGLDDKENHPILPSMSRSPSLQRNNTDMTALPGDSEDYVADSEDEATKNLKGRLFMKRYYKTKHGTYVPTLREYS